MAWNRLSSISSILLFILCHPSSVCVCVCVCARARTCAQSCLTLYNPLDCSLPGGSSVHGIFQARILERVAIFSSRGSSEPGDRTHGSCIAGRFFTTEPPGKPPHLTSFYFWGKRKGLLAVLFPLPIIRPQSLAVLLAESWLESGPGSLASQRLSIRGPGWKAWDGRPCRGVSGTEGTGVIMRSPWSFEN